MSVILTAADAIRLVRRLGTTAKGACVSYRALSAKEAFWRPSNQMGVLNTDLAKQLQASTLGARLWRLHPRQASTRHRHRQTTELYVLLEGTGRIRVGEDVLTLEPLDCLLVEPGTIRQVFNDTGSDQLWLMVGAPPETANTLEMTAEDLAWRYPDGPRAVPPELEASWAPAASDRTEDGCDAAAEDRLPTSADRGAHAANEEHHRHRDEPGFA